MKLISTLALTFFLAQSILALPVGQSNVLQARAALPVECGDPTASVPFFRLYNAGGTDHFYTTNTAERDSFISLYGYVSETAPGNIFRTQQPSTVPLYRLYNAGVQDHFYTTSTTERDTFINSNGYTSEGIAGYVYPNQICSSQPLYRLYRAVSVDHLYTTSSSEYSSQQSAGYRGEGIRGYILPLRQN
ncbi:hypothetical protein BDQ12DRAFT_722493 [Crucibulum laeve]|uniref:DUF5648 domain-containing protein n=1 Tax=Crucibulum laeve TaxID=68775 RepID=A0A5C3M2M1_9AGAR|nr:hypothetical protein BDQ12DRAFT_722493 [Crucibulum laeve]